MGWVDDHRNPPGLSPGNVKRWEEYVSIRIAGRQPEEAGAAVEIAAATQAAWESHFQALILAQRAEMRAQGAADDGIGPYAYADLCPQAQHALEDFDYFRKRYFGRDATPWQRTAADQCVALLETPHKEFVVINVCPGSGKSTLFTHDIALYMLCRKRSLRSMIGSRTERQASQYVNRIRRTLQERVPRNGAETTLTHDFGSFRPLQKDIWRNNEFVVAQPGVEHYGEKEPSFAGYGYDSGFLGGRFDFVIWDDLVDRHVLRSVEGRLSMQRWFDDEAVTRCEPGGLFLLQGQRLDADDLYRYALNIELEDGTKKFHHIKYRAHDDDICEGDHGHDAKYWPDGCLLDPVRVPWRDLAARKIQSSSRYLTVYQQEDRNWDECLVRPEWIDGGTVDGVHYDGCWDLRKCGAYPQIDPANCISIAGVDPSPTKDWGIVHFVYDMSTEKRYLIDIFRGPMPVTGLLDFDYVRRTYSGIMQDWQIRSMKAGFAIQSWVVETNAAQSFIIQSNMMQRWSAQHRVELTPHTTTIRKRNEDYGPQILGPLYRLGLVRLPAADRAKVAPLVEDVTQWNPESTFTFDTLMAQWFTECQLGNFRPAAHKVYARWTPSWTGGQRGLVFTGEK